MRHHSLDCLDSDDLCKRQLLNDHSESVHAFEARVDQGKT